MTKPILILEDLKTYFFTDTGTFRAVDGVSLTLNQGETLGIVGESGSGKSVTALSILRLLDPPGKIIGGKVLFDGHDLVKVSKEQIRKIRGNKISMIFQEPMSSLNPLYKVGDQIAEIIRLHQGLDRKASFGKAVELIKSVGIPEPQSRAKDYPHQLSGGMQQRIMIAMALSCRPRIMIADEPTTALDVTIQAQILKLMKSLQQNIGTSIIFITHDLGVIARMARKVAVMYAGKIVESCNVFDLFEDPLHPYTKALLESIPAGQKGKHANRFLRVIPGAVPNLADLPKGCAFAPRCADAWDLCRQKTPEAFRIDEDRIANCWKYAK